MNISTNQAIQLVRIQQYKTNHILHIILSVLTGGLWFPVWLLLTLSNSIERAKAVRRINRE